MTAPARDLPGRVETEAETGSEGEAGVDLSPLDGFTGFLLRLAQQRVFDEFHRRFGAEGLTPARFSVLAVLAANPDLRQGALAAALRIKAPNLVVMAARLEADGLIARRADAANRRATLLRLTPAGAALYRRLEPAVRAMEADLARPLPRPEYEALRAALRRLRDA